MFNPSYHIIGVAGIIFSSREEETDIDRPLEKRGKRLVNYVFIRVMYKPSIIANLPSKIRVSKLGFLNLAYTRSNCTQLDKGFYPRLNSIAKINVNLKVFVFFHGVCSLFALSHDLSS